MGQWSHLHFPSLLMRDDFTFFKEKLFNFLFNERSFTLFLTKNSLNFVTKNSFTLFYEKLCQFIFNEKYFTIFSKENYCMAFLFRYYLATQEQKPGQRHLYVVQTATDDPRRLEPQCITCDLGGVLWSSRYYYSNCTHFNALVSILSKEFRNYTIRQEI